MTRKMMTRTGTPMSPGGKAASASITDVCIDPANESSSHLLPPTVHASAR